MVHQSLKYLLSGPSEKKSADSCLGYSKGSGTGSAKYIRELGRGWSYKKKSRLIKSMFKKQLDFQVPRSCTKGTSRD